MGYASLLSAIPFPFPYVGLLSPYAVMGAYPTTHIHCSTFGGSKALIGLPGGRKVLGKRIVTFIVGGITRSELRVTHTLGAQLGRDITLGGTSMESASSFLNHLQVRNDDTGVQGIVQCGM